MIEVRIPKGGMSTVEVDVVAVHVVPGDAVAAGAVLVEVESEKATFEVECGEAGIVREVLVQVGDVMDVGEVVARLEPVPDGSSA